MGEVTLAGFLVGLVSGVVLMVILGVILVLISGVNEYDNEDLEHPGPRPSSGPWGSSSRRD